MNEFRSHRGTHPVIDQYPRNCINCGAPLDIHDQFPCPNRELTPKELRAYGMQRSKVSDEDKVGLDEILKGIFK